MLGEYLFALYNMISDNSIITVETKKDYSDNLNDFKEDIAILKKYLK